jgi:hypothetical protein
MKYPKMEAETKKVKNKKDPKIEFRKAILISILILSIGIVQIALVIGGRSWLIWRHHEGPQLTGEDEIYVPGSFLLPNRYLITVLFYIPTLWTEDLVGNITFTHHSSGNNYSFDYRVVGYMSYKLVDHDVISLSLIPGRYDVSWTNNLDDYAYTLTTHGFLNFFPKDGVYPYIQESIALIISSFIFVSLLVGAIRRYLKGRRNYAYHK